MINFFRKTRKKMADDNKPMKYIRYAIGEIVLVVIGILIALSINNWNGNRKDRELEKHLLKSLVENIEINCNRLESQIKAITRYRRDGRVIISAIENNLSYHDSLNNYFHFGIMRTNNMRLSSVGYKAIQNVGFEIITNEMLKKEIMVFFEESQPDFLATLEWGNHGLDNRERFIDEHFIQRPKDKDKLTGLIYNPFDGNNLLLNMSFNALIYKTDLQRRFFSFNMEDHLKDSQKLLKTIKEELKE